MFSFIVKVNDIQRNEQQFWDAIVLGMPPRKLGVGLSLLAITAHAGDGLKHAAQSLMQRSSHHLHFASSQLSAIFHVF
ncbi:hypothetical protein DQQ10_11310 [Pseudochryseolinea flava]|uniref:Uncharacterized protein n=1 Tax=Pseudochryseolinea flava TaxID=2059302 RepID=A0A364Y3R4_9BACT|nr:hypothetical protein DQQ10_11310 [Pseudochryseolinea flava]